MLYTDYKEETTIECSADINSEYLLNAHTNGLIVISPYRKASCTDLNINLTHVSLDYNEATKMSLIPNQYFSFDQQLRKINPDAANSNEIKDKVYNIIEKIISFNFDFFKIEVTNNDSVFFKLKRNDSIFYFEFLFNSIDDKELDQVIMSIYSGKKKLPSFAGNVDEAINEINNYLDEYCFSKVFSNEKKMSSRYVLPHRDSIPTRQQIH